MKHHRIAKKELFQAQVALFIAIGLQVLTRRLGTDVLPGSHYLIIATELVLAVFISFTINPRTDQGKGLHHLFAVILLGLISVANVSGLIFVIRSLITNGTVLVGQQLLATSVAIFITNIIVFALWYWEIDSPGLTRTHWSKHDKDFQFTQQDMSDELPDWQPQFGDYMYLSISNGINFASSDAKPITLQSKLLMASQALVSVLTLALLIARSVSILGS
ncbi:MAG TPA: hypothetical protein VLG25_01450 [Patescibacteria group bacterium]|nr:hypothetical protein [Patescibacteria group bacterium]